MEAVPGEALLMDDVDRRLVELLVRDGRMAFAELGREVGISATSVFNRVRRLEADGVITGYQASISASKTGYPLRVFVGVRAPQESIPALVELARSAPEVCEAYHTTGDVSFIAKVVARDDHELQRILAAFAQHGTICAGRVAAMPVDRVRT